MSFNGECGIVVRITTNLVLYKVWDRFWISFTSTIAVRKLLTKQNAGSLKKFSFKLGGNSPHIIFDDYDVEAAVEAPPNSLGLCIKLIRQRSSIINSISLLRGMH